MNGGAPRDAVVSPLTWPRAILFDLDDTLFDHRRASAIALGAMHAAYAPGLPFDAFSRKHAEVLEAFHARFLAGEFTLNEARVARMQTLFAAFGHDIDASTAECAARLYRDQHQSNRSLVAGAFELLNTLRGQARLGIVTNNSTAEQIEKLNALNIADFFETVVISEDVGVTKPDPKIFTIALERLGASANDTVFVGDNWANDIVGAVNVGMSAVWLDRDRETPALADLSGQNVPKMPASAGGSLFSVATIGSLMPPASVVAIIRKVHNELNSATDVHALPPRRKGNQ